MLTEAKAAAVKAGVFCPSCRHPRHTGRMCYVATPAKYYVTPLTHPLDQEQITCGCTYELGSVNAGRLGRGGFQTS